MQHAARMRRTIQAQQSDPLKTDRDADCTMHPSVMKPRPWMHGAGVWMRQSRKCDWGGVKCEHHSGWAVISTGVAIVSFRP
jgi:hypothetical protein